MNTINSKDQLRKSMAAPLIDWILKGIPNSIEVELFDDVGGIYEAQLARMELSKWWEEPRSFRKRAAYFEKVNGETTYHYYISNIRGKGQIGRSCQYLTHWFYPYKAKFHPQMIKALINWMGLKGNDVLLDPFVGSGTALVEAKTLGLKSIGIDINPVCRLISQVKCDLLEMEPDDLKEISVQKAFYFFDSKRKKIKLTGKNETLPFGEEDIFEFKEKEKLKKFFQLCYLYALSDFTYINKELWEAFNSNFYGILKTVREFYELKKKLNLRLGEAEVTEGNARAIYLKDETIDGIITSPPYSIAVNYIQQDIQALNYLGINHHILVKDMVGLRGNGAQRIDNYYEDMQKSFIEMCRVLKPEKFCTVVIGDVTYNGERLPIASKFIDFAEEAGFSCFDVIKRPILGGYARLRYEYILIFQKKKY